MNTTHAFSPLRRRLLRNGLLACGGMLLAGRVGAAESMNTADEGMHHHMMPPVDPEYRRTLVHYTIPDVRMVDADGEPVALRTALSDKPVILDFIFTTCGAICPVMSRTFAQVQAGLGPERDKVRMVSISIDPEQDTPAILKAYAEKYGAGPEWEMLTGSLGDSVTVQRAFDVYRGNKMDHLPATFLRGAAGQPWVRLDGFASAADILREYRQIVSG